MLKRILYEMAVRMWIRVGSGQDALVGFCQHGNEPSVSVKDGIFVD
jgi:hypothetical protein